MCNSQEYKARAIDLYSGIGGWTLGLKMSDVENVASFEWWSDANHTHNMNYGTDHDEVDIRQLELKDLPEPGTIDLVLGSPPCTQFSFANRGGNGDLADGLKDIYKFLQIVEYLKPKYWAMENVPRVSNIIKKELQAGGQLHRFIDLFSVNEVVNAADYGAPQARKRMIAGHFPVGLFHAYRSRIQPLTLRDVIEALQQDTITDPIYGITLPAEKVTDNYHEEPLSEEEERINREAKTFHPVYNKMSFPEKLDRPSRTVTATCTRVSRESIVVKDERYPGKFRRLNIRERGLTQGFPITYQYYGKGFTSRFKMIGNAIPPVLSYFIVQSMLETPVNELKLLHEVDYKHPMPAKLPEPVAMDSGGNKYPATRRFMFAIPHLRFGSGVRFDLSNRFEEGKVKWEIKFYYGNSKKIKSQALTEEVFNIIMEMFDFQARQEIYVLLEQIDPIFDNYTPEKLQMVWCRKEEGLHPFEVVDKVGRIAKELVKKYLPQQTIGSSAELHSVLDEEENKKLSENSNYILGGILVGAWTNQLLDLSKKEMTV